MKTVKHAPGPWKFGNVVIVDSNNESICHMVNHLNWPLNTLQANAHLIAAAPELLEALKLAINVLDTINTHPDWMRKLKDIAAKAEGKI